MASYTQENRSAAIGTPLGEDVLLLRSFSGREELGRPFEYSMELWSTQHDIKFEDIVGENVTVRLKLRSGGTRYFNGYVSRFSQIGGGEASTFGRYRATVVPWFWFLTRTADCRIFQEMKVPDIIDKVFRDHGFTNFKLSLNGTYRTWEYCVQYRETTFNFVCRLMEQEGIFFYFEHENGVHTMILVDSVGSLSAFPKHEEIEYRTENQAGMDQDYVSDWEVEQMVQPGMYSLNDFDFKAPKKGLLAKANKDRPHAASHFEIYDYPGEYVEYSDGESYSKIRMEELQVGFERCSARADSRGMACGYKFKLIGHPRDSQNKEYYLTGVEYDLDNGGFGADESSGGFFSCHVRACSVDTPFRSARRTPKPVVQGPQTAIVTGPSGEEIHTDEHGRVKVHFYWDHRNGKADENSSCWIRVSQFWAGMKWGAMFLPRVGHEVIVEFLEGDPDRPIVTGRVYNGDNKPPYDLPAEKTKSTIKSNSSKGGGGFNELRFEDKKGSEQIFIHAEKNYDLRVKSSAFEWVGYDRHLVVGHDKFEHVKHIRNELVDEDHVEEIGKDRHLTVKGKEAKKVVDTLSLTVEGDVAEDFKKSHHEKVGGDYYLTASNIVIEGSSNITLKVGGSSIAIDASGIGLKTSGMIKMECTDLKAEAKAMGEIKANAMLKLEAGAMAELKSPMTSVKGDGMTMIKGGLVMIN